MNADDLLHQAVTALSSAKLLLDTGDSGDACNRAYYAMFDAARAAIEWHLFQARFFWIRCRL